MRNLDITKKIAEKVKDAGGRTFLVGGYVRDAVQNRSSKDIDLEIHGIAPDMLYSILSEFGRVDTQGVSFGVYKIKGYDIDIAQPRMEHATGRGHKDFEVYVDPFIGYKKAAERRDFTFNAMMQDILTGEIIDEYGGMKDLKDGIIRHVNDESFKEDPLRVFRAAQFAARFGFTVAPETMRLMSEMDTSALSRERVFGELEKALLKAENPSVFFETLKVCNQLEWFKELRECIGCDQNPIWHPEGDVWTHTMRTVDIAAKMRVWASNPTAFMLLAVCHDLGKPAALTVDNKGNYHTYGHEAISAELAEKLVGRLTTNNEIRKYIVNMSGIHMKPHHCFDNSSSVYKTNLMYDEAIKPYDLTLFAYADTASTTHIEAAKNENIWLNERLKEYEKAIMRPQITGADLIAAGIAPRKEYSKILNECHKKTLSGQSKESILKGVCKQYKKRKEIREQDPSEDEQER